MINGIIKGVVILLGIGVTIFIGYVIVIVYAFGGFDKDFSVKDLKENFRKNEIEIYELKKYFKESQK